MLSFLRDLFGLGRGAAPPPPARDARPTPGALSPADVVLDVECEAGLLWLVLVNLGGEPALDVRVELEPQDAGALMALGGEFDLRELPLFAGLGMLRGGKQQRVLLDPAGAWFARELDGHFTARVRWKERAGQPRSAEYHHDLAAFRVGVERIGS